MVDIDLLLKDTTPVIARLVVTNSSLAPAVLTSQISVEGLEYFDLVWHDDTVDMEQASKQITGSDLLFCITEDEPKDLENAARILQATKASEVLCISLVMLDQPLSPPWPNILDDAALLIIPGDGTQHMEDNKKHGITQRMEHAITAIKGVVELLTRPGMVGVDYTDIRSVMGISGMAASASGCSQQIEVAIDSVLQTFQRQKVSLTQARGALINITGGLNLSIETFDMVIQAILSRCVPSIPSAVGMTIAPEMHEDIQVTVVATGLHGYSG